ncbi:hypothetical protein AU195_22695 [Mycobacterium sp. IS-1496]|uniref:hypothetical protein n=1 Tax=Mycobacterium sp. IS-1496 TaxID=1772284 RepID=UPI0007417F6D|nr:hypothetical protein [Mycobacterium sp. IS-1496]KUI38808.1 hypothetical protein AU195_22695 [Mycobacterium sp. IS-1496]
MTEKNDDALDVTGEPEVSDAESSAVELDAADDTVGDDGAAHPAQPSGPSRRRGPKIAAAALAVALVASVGAAAWLFFTQFRVDQETGPEAAKVALDAATEGSVALLSYSPDTLEQDFATAKTRLTGDFLEYYTQFTEEIVTPAAKQKSVKTDASVVQAAVSEIQPESAEVLLFINQTTTSKENPDGAYAASAVKVGLAKVDGAWLISAFDPV